MANGIVVIGGGIVGLCTARELQAAGREVTLIDRAPVGTGCSYANAGWLTPCFAMPLPQPGMLLKSLRWLLDPSSPLHIQPTPSLRLARWLWNFQLATSRRQMLRSIEVLTRLSTYTLDFFAALAERTRERGGPPLAFENRGLLMVSGVAAGVDAARAEMELMADRGIAGRAMGRDELLAFEPTLRPLVKGGVFFPDEAQIDPYPTSLAMATEFHAAGGRTLQPAEAYDFTTAQGRITGVVTTQGVLPADLVVLATGSWSPDLARRLGIRVPILGGKGYSMTLEGVTRKPGHPIMIVDRKIAVTPFPDRLRVAGTLELVDQDFSISVSRLRGIRRGAHEYLDLGRADDGDRTAAGDPAAPPAVRDIWRGLRPCTPDGVPLIGFSARIPNLFYCTGHQMLGLQTAPGSARLAADLILGNPPITNPEPFRPGRFE
jgi:D-amino-acid dehydrogenase